MSGKVTLNTNQRRAIEALLTEPTIKAAAEKAGLARRTVHRYLNNDDFRAELRKRQDAILSAATAALVGGTGEASEVLREVMNDPDASEATRVRAALGWWQQTGKQVEMSEIIERLQNLEAMLNERN